MKTRIFVIFFNQKYQRGKKKSQQKLNVASTIRNHDDK